MVLFLIYLFETGICLSLLFLVYYLFLREETYFTFNRIYLIAILVFSLLLPLLHFNLTLPESNTVIQGVDEMKRIKSYYENLISLSDPDYKNSFTEPFKENNASNFEDGAILNFGKNVEVNNSKKNIQNKKTGFGAELNWARLFLLLYFMGTLFFTGRLFLLFWWLRQTIKKYGCTTVNGIKLIMLNNEVPPFSFFRFVFLFQETATHSGYSQILAHERVHISQKHSFDLLLAHAITILQWFNPFAWLINKAMKTNHEYIADRNVVEQGYELFDYQSLLLKQMISIRSVELVNNFNLLNIKKRIAMMTKIKSGFWAQLKALVIIPAAVFVFFFFAEITFAQSNSNQNNESEKIEGLWERIGDKGYGKIISLKTNKIDILIDNGDFKKMEYSVSENTSNKNLESFVSAFKDVKGKSHEIRLLKLMSANPNVVFDVAYILRGDELIIDWDREHVTRFKKKNSKNSLDLIIAEASQQIEPVQLDFYRISDNPDNNFFILMNRKGQILIDGERTDFVQLPSRINKVKSAGIPFTENDRIPILVIDAGCEMAHVHTLYQKLRGINELRHILSVKPKDRKVPEIFYHNVGIPRLLPPEDAQLMDEKKVEKNGMKIIRVDLTNEQCTPEWAATIFQKEIQKDKKYVVLLSYKNETIYQEYMGILNKFYQTIYAGRNKLALERYNLAYDDLAKAQQKEIRKSFPMIITERNLDQMEG